jgi:diaminohydroxyphosphoribosylaminopyrimidine deaminase/5-amino-6-(5-phosphoribosylamino)uracil reductase
LVTHLNVPKYLDEFIEIIQVPLLEEHLDLKTLSQKLLEKNICEVLIEAGATLNAAFISNKLVDELNIFICPKIITDSASINAFESSIVQEMKNAYPLELLEVKQFDSDLLLKYQVLY